jgi:hypothetical protein
MELLNINKNTGNCEILVTGNSRIRILNDYENNLININNISYNGFSFKIKACNPYKLNLDNKFYAKIIYINKVPIIKCLWAYDEFVPSYAIYPIKKIKQSTLDEFKIKEQIVINNFELQKNIKILNNDYKNYLYFSKPKKKIKCLSKYSTQLNNRSEVFQRKTIEQNDDSGSDSFSLKND